MLEIKRIEVIGEKGLIYYISMLCKSALLCFVLLFVLFSAYQIAIVGLMEGIINGVTFGLHVTAISIFILFVYDAIMRLRLYSIYKKMDFGLIQKRRIIVNGPTAKLLSTIKSILSTTNITKRFKLLNGKTGFKLETLNSIECIGEKVEIIIKNETDCEANITIISKPKIKLNLFDYGKNFENVELLCNVISAELAAQVKS